MHSADVLNLSVRLLHYVNRRAAFLPAELEVYNRVRRMYDEICSDVSDEVRFGSVDMRPVGLPALPDAAGGNDVAMQDGQEAGQGARANG